LFSGPSISSKREEILRVLSSLFRSFESRTPIRIRLSSTSASGIRAPATTSGPK